MCAFTRKIRTNQFVSDPQLFEAHLKERKFSFLALVKRLNELHAVVCLNAFDLEKERP